MRINKNQPKQHVEIPEKEVTLQAYSSVKINDLLESITICESRLQEELTLELINTLME